MKIDELLLESYDTSKARIEHAEDLIFSGGSKGAARAVYAIEQAASNPNLVSIKPDGRPAIKWGRDTGGFVMGDKYMNPLPHSIEELVTILQNRKGGGREGLIQMYRNLWNVFEASVPSIDGYLFGDLLYSSTPPTQGNEFVMKPNTVEYRVPVQSFLGKSIEKSVAGIVVHTYLKSNSQTGQHIDNLAQIGGIIPRGELLMIADTLPATSPFRPNTAQIRNLIQKYSAALDEFLSTMPAGFAQLAKKFVNYKVKEKNFDNMAFDFLQWARLNSSGNMLNSINSIQSNNVGYQAMWALFNGIVAAKNQIVNHFDKLPSQMTATINGQLGQEGYLVHTNFGPIKFIDRFKFSAANFAKDA